jgi:hypothetical protein
MIIIRYFLFILLGMVLAACLTLASSLIWPAPASAATDVWLFYGAGPHGFSQGVDQIAARMRRFAVVHGPYDYRDTQRAFDEIRATPSDHRIVIGGYSCGAASALVVGGSLGSRQVHVLGLQPSLWCGRYPTTSNMRYFAETYGLCWQTLGLGCYQADGASPHATYIERPDRHLKADQDLAYQNDMVLGAYAIADPGRGARTYHRWLRNTTYLFHADPGHIHLWERRGWFQ